MPQAGHAGPFGYAGALYTPEVPAAPWHMRNRQYHPGLGRFLQTDPIGVAGGINLYAYVGGDPVNLVDPWGLWDAQTDVDDVVVIGIRNPWNRTLTRMDATHYYTPYEFNQYYQIEDVVITAYRQTMCQNNADTSWERWLTAAGIIGDMLVLGGAISEQPHVVIVGGVISGGASILQIGTDLIQRDMRGAAGNIVGFVAGLVPGVRQTGRGRAVFDAGRRPDGTFMRNSRGRRETVEQGSRIAQGGIANDAAASAAAAGC